MRLNWFLPLSRDVEHIGMWPEEGTYPSLSHLTAIMEETESAGFDALLVPATYRNHHDALTASAAILARTRRAGLIIAVRPFQIHPAQCAKMTATLADWFPGRVRLNVVGGGGDEPGMLGVHDDRERRQRRLAEWLEVFHGVLYADRTFSYSGEIYQVDDFMMVAPAREHVPLYLSGSSETARQLLFRYGDTYLMFGVPPSEAKEEVIRLREAEDFREGIEFCMRLHLIVRETSAEAWAAADDLISRIDPRVASLMRGESHDKESKLDVQQRMTARDGLVVSPNLWAGVGTARRGAAVALVGNPDEVVERLVEYGDLGIDSVIVSGYPKLREAARFRELVLPRLREADLVAR